MSLGKTKIPYLTRLWHPTTGCSADCPYCWARDLVRNRLAPTMKGLPKGYGYPAAPGPFRLHDMLSRSDPFTPTFHSDRLADPLRARKPQVIGVSFLGDLFDPGITDEQIAAVFGVMAVSPQHTFIVLTKQAERAEKWARFGWQAGVPVDPWTECHFQALHGDIDDMVNRNSVATSRPWPLPTVWIGISISDQATANARIPHLLRTPAARRWVSYEPARGPIDLNQAASGIGTSPLYSVEVQARMIRGSEIVPAQALDAVVMGGESGPTSRQHPMDMDWARSMAAQCKAAGVAFALKQGSGLHPEHWPEVDGARHDAVPWMEVSRG